MRLLHRTPLAGALESGPARWIRGRAFAVSADEVLAVVGACRAAGVPCWLAGGWGMDALVGQHTRRHTDIDLCIEVADDGEARAIRALEPLGYRVTARRAPSGSVLPIRSVLRSPEGKVIDLLLVTRDPATATTADDLPRLDPVDVAEGLVAGTAVACVSAAFQIRAHSGYVPKGVDHSDMAALFAHLGVPPSGAYRRPAFGPVHRPAARTRRWAAAARQFAAPGRASTALVIPVPAAVPTLAAVGSPELDGLGPHVTVIYPFAPLARFGPRERSQLGELLAPRPRFPFRLAALAGFPDVTYLEPTPADPFVDLTRAVERAFPAYPTYGGRFAEIVPHLTVAYGLEPSDLDSTVSRYLPIETEASEVVVMALDRWGRWRAEERYPLGLAR